MTMLVSEITSSTLKDEELIKKFYSQSKQIARRRKSSYNSRLVAETADILYYAS